MDARLGDRTPMRLLAVVLLVSAFLLGNAGHARASADDVWTIRRFDTQEKVMALTFDCGSDRGYAAAILDTLQAHGVKASFGMTGVWAEQNPDLVRRMVNEGHHLINHSWNHPSFPSISPAERASQLRRTADLVRSLTGVELAPYFRPPYGEYDTATLADLAANGYTINVMWTTDTLGWAGRTTSEIVNKTLSEAAPGGIVLLHVGAASQDSAALESIIHGLRDRGYRMQTVADFVAPQSRYFPETGHTVSGAFLRYWNSFGGLPTFGYPLSDPYVDQSSGLTMQWFERVRMELHPGAWPARYDVLLGRLGADLTAGRENEAPFRPVVAYNDEHCTFYPQTGHRLCWGFRTYWQSHGALEIFGYPLSEEFTEKNPDTGQYYTVQYFERARFEWHPENPLAWQVLGGRLGAQLMP